MSSMVSTFFARVPFAAPQDAAAVEQPQRNAAAGDSRDLAQEENLVVYEAKRCD